MLVRLPQMLGVMQAACQGLQKAAGWQGFGGRAGGVACCLKLLPTTAAAAAAISGGE